MRCLSALLAFIVVALIVALPVVPASAAPAELNIVIVEGEGATNNIRQRTAREPIVQVEDENHKPVAGAAVVFALPSHGAGGVFANGAQSLTTVTNQQGQAVARGFQANGAKGTYQMHVNASMNGQTANAHINMTNVAAAGAAAGVASGISGKLIAVIAVVGAAAAGGAIAAVKAGGGNNGSNGTGSTSTTITAGAGTVGPPR